MRSTRTAATAAALLTLTLLAGCGGGDDDKSSDDKVTETVTPTTSDTTATEASTEASTPTDTTSETPMDPTGDVTQEQLDAALLTPEEVGAGFVAGTYTDTDDPPLCDENGTPLDQQFPPQVQGGTEIEQSDGIAALQEEITIYESDEVAAQAFAAGAAGLDCTDGTTNGTAVKIGPPQDVTANVDTSGLGTTTAWEVTSDSFQGVLVVTVAHRVVLAISYAAAPDADTSSLPNPVDVQATAFAKALAS
jgi:hypothetical protein